MEQRTRRTQEDPRWNRVGSAHKKDHGSRGREQEQQPMTVADKRAAAEWAVGGGGAESAPAHQPPQERRTMG